jgi:hypothetical protein
MSKVAIQGDPSGSGTFTIAAPNSNNNRTLNLPDNAGTILTSASALAAANLSGRVPAANANLGAVLQVVQAITTTPRLDMTTNTPVQRVSLSITPTSATSKIMLFYTAGDCISTSTTSARLASAFYRNGSSIRQFTAEVGRGVAGIWYTVSGSFLDSPSSTSAQTYAVFHWNNDTGTVIVGDSDMPSVLTAMEIAA